MDMIAMWIGYIVMGISSGIFVLGGGLIVADVFGRRLWKKLKAIDDISRLRTCIDHLRECEEQEAARRGDPVIPQPQPWRQR